MFEIMQEFWNVRRDLQEKLKGLDEVFHLLQEKYKKENGYYWKDP